LGLAGYARVGSLLFSLFYFLGSRWLTLAGFACVILSLTGVLLLQYQDKVFTYAQPAFFGEVALVLWLVIKGAKPPALDVTSSSSAVG